MRILTITVLVALLGALATPAQAVKHCKCRPYVKSI